jgi:hypothetical protein
VICASSLVEAGLASSLRRAGFFAHWTPAGKFFRGIKDAAGGMLVG